MEKYKERKVLKETKDYVLVVDAGRYVVYNKSTGVRELVNVMLPSIIDNMVALQTMLDGINGVKLCDTSFQYLEELALRSTKKS
jgi:hypothetical protein